MDKFIEKYMRDKGYSDIVDTAKKPLLDDSKIKRVEIIILKYKSPDMEADCVSRILKYTRHPYKLTVFDNRGNGPNTAKIWNKLIKESTCDYVMFIDSDAFVQDTIGMINGRRQEDGVCWLEEMMRAFNHKSVAFVGPSCGSRATSTVQAKPPADADPTNIDGHLSGYCFLTKKSIYDELGYFDEDFNFYGQESDWIDRVRESNDLNGTNYKLMLAHRAHVTHGYNDEASIAAKESEKEGEFNSMMESEYSYFMWNKKKQYRLNQKGKEYTFHNDEK